MKKTKNWKIITVITLTVVAVAIIASVAFASAYNPYRAMTPTTNGFAGMMGGLGTYTSAAPNTNLFPYVGRGGCMGWAGVGGYSGAPSYTTNTTTPLTIEQATQVAQRYVTALNNPDLKVTQVEEYANNFYIQVGEKSTGNGAFELLVDKYTGNIYPEMGPNMMWNTKYTTTTGMMGIFNGLRGMMGLQRTATTPMTIAVDQAKTNAQQYLDTNYLGTTVGDVTAFHGYYTVEVLQNGNPYGMLSVNGYTGQVWYHTWHGTFVQETESP